MNLNPLAWPFAAKAIGSGIVLALAGCASAPQSAAPQSAAPQSAAPQSAPSTPEGPGGIPVVATYREGRPFSLRTTYSDGTTASWQLTLDSVTCGGSSIFSRQILNSYYSSEGQPTTIPQPGSGMKFCLIKFTVTNAGDSNRPWMASDATVNVGSDAYKSDENGPGYDPEQAYMQSDRASSDFGQNPGAIGPSWGVFQIPAGAKVTSVSVQAGGASAFGTETQDVIEVTGA